MTVFKLRILFVEDVLEDYELETRELRREGLDFTSHRTESREDLLHSLEEFRPDLVISDFTLPTWNGLTVLESVREKLPEVTFVFMSGTIGEEPAIDCLRKGRPTTSSRAGPEGLGSGSAGR